jgi:ABC-2 type transport system permease protein
MIELLKIEWMKLKNYRTFWTLFVLYLVSIVGINYITYRIQQRIYDQAATKGAAEMIVGARPYAYPLVWQMTSYMSSFLLFVPGLMMIIFITNEYSFKTHRQNILDGWSRSDFISVKLFETLLFALLSTMMVFLTSIMFGSFSDKAFTWENVHYVGFYFLQALSYGLFALLFAILFRRGGLAIGVFFLYTVVLENLLAGLLNKYAGNIGRYLPLESSDNLIPFPAFRQVQNQLIKPQNIPALLIAVCIYLLLYVVLSHRKFLKDDL